MTPSDLFGGPVADQLKIRTVEAPNMGLTFFVPGLPVAQPRARSSGFVNAKSGQVRTHMYTPGTADAWKAAVAAAYAEHSGGEIIQAGGIELDLEFVMTRPKGHFGTGRNAGTLKASAPTDHVSKPDGDNLKKAVMDALKGLAWHDDSQVCRWSGAKRYAAAGEPAGCRITITRT